MRQPGWSPPPVPPTSFQVSPELLQAGDDLDSTGHAFYTDLYTMIDTLPLPYKSPAQHMPRFWGWQSLCVALTVTNSETQHHQRTLLARPKLEPLLPEHKTPKPAL